LDREWHKGPKLPALGLHCHRFLTEQCSPAASTAREPRQAHKRLLAEHTLVAEYKLNQVENRQALIERILMASENIPA
jgi:hypothetical protein